MKIRLPRGEDASTITTQVNQRSVDTNDQPIGKDHNWIELGARMWCWM